MLSARESRANGIMKYNVQTKGMDGCGLPAGHSLQTRKATLIREREPIAQRGITAARIQLLSTNPTN
jgi:hypothetical protein